MDFNSTSHSDLSHNICLGITKPLLSLVYVIMNRHSSRVGAILRRSTTS